MRKISFTYEQIVNPFARPKLTLAMVLLVAFWCNLAAKTAIAQDTQVEKAMVTLLNAASGRTAQFHVRVVAQMPVGGATEDFMLEAFRNGADYDLALVHKEYLVNLRRRADGTALALPKHKVVFIGKGDVDLSTSDHLDATSLAVRLIGPNSSQGRFAPILFGLDPVAVLRMAKSSMGAKVDEATGVLSLGGMQIRSPLPDQISTKMDAMKVRAGLSKFNQPMLPLEEWPGYRVEQVDRNELEQSISRAIRRATEIFMPGEMFLEPYAGAMQVDNGEVRSIDGQRIALLRGTPEQIGKAHGEALNFEVNQSIDSAIHVLGLLQTLTTGKWFLQELEQQVKQIEPHLPKQYLDEASALAQAVNQPLSQILALNLVSDKLHGSEFALSGSATADGKLYHGCVWDNLTTVALQDSAVHFVISAEGKTPLASFGYAGMVGCLAGLNEAQISIGDSSGAITTRRAGIPTSILARMALEDCSSLEQVAELIKSSPRATDSFCVAADGKTSDVVVITSKQSGVESTGRGEVHSKLKQPVQDGVLLSGGPSLETLTQRIQEQQGGLDATAAMALMARPVANDTSLQKVLYVPAEGILYSANASRRPLDDQQPMVELNMRELIASPLAPKPE